MTEFDAIEKEARATFAKRFTKALEDLGFDTRAKRAEFLVVSYDQIANYEKGKSFPPIGQLVCYARRLGCSIEYLTNENVTVKTPDTGVKAVAQATGLSEEAAQLLVTMKKHFQPQLAALDALLVSCLGYDLKTKQYRYDGIGGIVSSNAEYFRIVNEVETKLIEDGEATEDPTKRYIARMYVEESTKNLLEDGANAARLCRIYRKNLERLESEQNKKGGSDNGSGHE